MRVTKRLGDESRYEDITKRAWTSPHDIRRDIENKIDSLMLYENVGVKDHDVISSAYKGELVQMKDANNKQIFDM